MDANVLIRNLEERLPEMFTRRFICRELGGYLSIGGLANLDSKGLGPGGLKTKKTVVYSKETFLPWLKKRLEGTSPCAQ